MIKLAEPTVNRLDSEEKRCQILILEERRFWINLVDSKDGVLRAVEMGRAPVLMSLVASIMLLNRDNARHDIVFKEQDFVWAFADLAARKTNDEL